jgi:hypothetical protein
LFFTSPNPSPNDVIQTHTPSQAGQFMEIGNAALEIAMAHAGFLQMKDIK